VEEETKGGKYHADEQEKRKREYGLQHRRIHREKGKRTLKYFSSLRSCRWVLKNNYIK
jgi:hypothetical protein